MEFCPLCRNHCPLDNPNCKDVVTEEFRAHLAQRKADAESHCAMCPNHCAYTNLQCETGKLIAKFKGKLPAE